ncbi:MAG: hypothetical protein ACAI18_04715, partial [Gemmatimonadales bacterium]
MPLVWCEAPMVLLNRMRELLEARGVPYDDDRDIVAALTTAIERLERDPGGKAWHRVVVEEVVVPRHRVEAVLEAVGRGLEDLDAGRVVDEATFVAALEEGVRFPDLYDAFVQKHLPDPDDYSQLPVRITLTARQSIDAFLDQVTDAVDLGGPWWEKVIHAERWPDLMIAGERLGLVRLG